MVLRSTGLLDDYCGGTWSITQDNTLSPCFIQTYGAFLPLITIIFVFFSFNAKLKRVLSRIISGFSYIRYATKDSKIVEKTLASDEYLSATSSASAQSTTYPSTVASVNSVNTNYARLDENATSSARHISGSAITLHSYLKQHPTPSSTASRTSSRSAETSYSLINDFPANMTESTKSLAVDPYPARSSLVPLTALITAILVGLAPTLSILLDSMATKASEDSYSYSFSSFSLPTTAALVYMPSYFLAWCVYTYLLYRRFAVPLPASLAYNYHPFLFYLIAILPCLVQIHTNLFQSKALFTPPHEIPLTFLQLVCALLHIIASILFQNVGWEWLKKTTVTCLSRTGTLDSDRYYTAMKAYHNAWAKRAFFVSNCWGHYTDMDGENGLVNSVVGGDGDNRNNLDDSGDSDMFTMPPSSHSSYVDTHAPLSVLSSRSQSTHNTNATATTNTSTSTSTTGNAIASTLKPHNSNKSLLLSTQSPRNFAPMFQILGSPAFSRSPSTSPAPASLLSLSPASVLLERMGLPGVLGADIDNLGTGMGTDMYMDVNAEARMQLYAVHRSSRHGELYGDEDICSNSNIMKNSKGSIHENRVGKSGNNFPEVFSESYEARDISTGALLGFLGLATNILNKKDVDRDHTHQKKLKPAVSPTSSPPPISTYPSTYSSQVPITCPVVTLTAPSMKTRTVTSWVDMQKHVLFDDNDGGYSYMGADDVYHPEPGFSDVSPGFGKNNLSGGFIHALADADGDVDSSNGNCGVNLHTTDISPLDLPTLSTSSPSSFTTTATSTIASGSTPTMADTRVCEPVNIADVIKATERRHWRSIQRIYSNMRQNNQHGEKDDKNDVFISNSNDCDDNSSFLCYEDDVGIDSDDDISEIIQHITGKVPKKTHSGKTIQEISKFPNSYPDSRSLLQAKHLLPPLLQSPLSSIAWPWEFHANIWEKISFSWINPLLSLGNSHIIDMSDLDYAAPYNTSMRGLAQADHALGLYIRRNQEYIIRNFTAAAPTYAALSTTTTTGEAAAPSSIASTASAPSASSTTSSTPSSSASISVSMHVGDMGIVDTTALQTLERISHAIETRQYTEQEAKHPEKYDSETKPSENSGKSSVKTPPLSETEKLQQELSYLPGARNPLWSWSSVLYVIWSVTSRKVIQGCILKLLGDILGYFPSIFLNLLIMYATDMDSVPFWGGERGYYGFFIGTILVLSNLSQAQCLQHSYHLMIREGARARHLVIAMIYRKVLSMSSATRDGIGAGQITNIMTTDSMRVDLIYWMGYYIIFAPIQCIGTVALLIYYLGYSSLIGVLVLVIMLPIQLQMSKIASNFTSRNQEFTDKRVSLTLELLNSIRVIKAQAWEEVFFTLVSYIRRKECWALLLRQIYNSIQAMVLQAAPSIVSTATFFTYALAAGEVLTPAIAFTSLTLFNMLQVTLWAMPYTVQYIVEFTVAIRRIATVMAMPDKEIATVTTKYTVMPISEKSENPGFLEIPKSTIASVYFQNTSPSCPSLSSTPSTSSVDSAPALAFLPAPTTPASVAVHLHRVPLDTIKIGEIRIENTDFWIQDYVSPHITTATVTFSGKEVGCCEGNHGGSSGNGATSTPNTSTGTSTKITTHTPPLHTTLATHTCPTKSLTIPIPTLHVSRLTCAPGSLNLVVGGVGSGKTFLLQCILGEIASTPSVLGLFTPPAAGAIPSSSVPVTTSTSSSTSTSTSISTSISTSPLPLPLACLPYLPLHSPVCHSAHTHPLSLIAYVPQSAWIFAGTVRENIILDAEYIPDLFQETIMVCGLASDIENMPQREFTLVGEKGSTLSGGQKQRINIARAVYRRHVCSIFLFDAPLAALDAHVGQHIYDNVLGPHGILQKKTRVIVSHQLDCAKDADQIIVMQAVQGGPELHVHSGMDGIPIDKTSEDAGQVSSPISEKASPSENAIGKNEDSGKTNTCIIPTQYCSHALHTKIHVRPGSLMLRISQAGAFAELNVSQSTTFSRNPSGIPQPTLSRSSSRTLASIATLPSPFLPSLPSAPLPLTLSRSASPAPASAPSPPLPSISTHTTASTNAQMDYTSLYTNALTLPTHIAVFGNPILMAATGVFPIPATFSEMLHTALKHTQATAKATKTGGSTGFDTSMGMGSSTNTSTNTNSNINPKLNNGISGNNTRHTGNNTMNMNIGMGLGAGMGEGDDHNDNGDDVVAADSFRDGSCLTFGKSMSIVGNISLDDPISVSPSSSISRAPSPILSTSNNASTSGSQQKQGKKNRSLSRNNTDDVDGHGNIDGNNNDGYDNDADEADSVDVITPSAAVATSDGCDEELIDAGEGDDVERIMTSQEETRQSGQVPWATYYRYLQSMNIPIACICLVFCIGQVVIARITDYWLSAWSGDTYHKETIEYVTIYAYLQAGTVLTNLICNILCAIAGVNASKILYQNLLISVLNTNVQFFDITPIGRITNRFNSDISFIDSTLATAFFNWINLYLQILSFIIMMSMQIIYIIPIFLPVAIIFIYISNYFKNTCRELRLLEAVSKSPIYIHFDETLDGIVPIRCYYLSTQYMHKMNTVLDNHLRPKYLGQCLNRWLAVRLDALGAFILICIIWASLAFGDVSYYAASDETRAGHAHLNASLLGLVVGYALTLTSKVNWLVRGSVDTENQMNSVTRVFEYSNLRPEAASNPYQLADDSYREMLSGRPTLPARNMMDICKPILDDPPQNLILPPSLVTLTCSASASSASASVAAPSSAAVASSAVSPPSFQYIFATTCAFARAVRITNNQEKWPTSGKIIFRDVKARYRPELPLVLRGVNLELPAGTKIAIVGRTGAGKSSILQILLRIVDHEATRERVYPYQRLIDAGATSLYDDISGNRSAQAREEAECAGVGEGRSGRRAQGKKEVRDDSMGASLLAADALADDSNTPSSSSSSSASTSTSVSASTSLSPYEGIFAPTSPLSGLEIDGIDIAMLPLHTLRKHICIIPQDPTVFSQSIRFNLSPESSLDIHHDKHSVGKNTSTTAPPSTLAPFDAGISKIELLSHPTDGVFWQALEDVSLLTIVASLPGGLDYQLKNPQDVFSQGQRQLLCMARALVRKCKIVMLDECTASVDAQTDNLVQELIHRAFKDSTVITIAHRINTVLDYDSVVVMRMGRVVEVGHPRTLLRKEGSKFRALAMGQKS